MGAAILDLARTSLMHDGSCHQGGFRQEDIMFCNGPCMAHVVFIPGIWFSILNELTFQVMWLQMTRHPLHFYVRVAA